MTIAIHLESRKKARSLGLSSREYFLATVHRAENVDDKFRLKEILWGLKRIAKDLSMPVVFPVHPRTRKMAESFGYDFEGIQAINPVGFLEFLQLESNARLALIDSGGVQEETCILGVPCVTVRDNTERPETLEVGSNILAGADALRMIENAKRVMRQGNGWKNPFGDGKASELILDSVSLN